MINPRIIFLAVTCHVLTGSASVAMRYLAGSMEPIDIAFMRYLAGGLIVLPLAFINRCRWPGWNITTHVALLGLVFFAIFPWLVAIAFNYTTAARGALVLSTMPLWSMLLGYYLKHEHLSARRSLGVFLAVAGVAVTLNPLTAIFLAWWLLGELLTRFFFAGAVMVLGGLMLALIPGKVAVNEFT